MKDLLKDLITYLCKFLGCPEGIEDSALLGLTIIFIFSIIIGYLVKLTKYLINKRNQKFLNKNLGPDYSKSDVEKYLSNYVTQYYQNLSPAVEEEPNPKYASVARNKIIKLFINKIFVGKAEHKYFILLAGAGMGKTAFLINLYLKYKNKPKYFFSPHKYNIELLPLGSPDVLDRIQAIKNKNETILLLDAFDEDTEALSDYKARMNKLLTESRMFHVVIVTCRTQFFANEAEEPYATGLYSFGEHGQYYFQKLYLSYFNQKDINKYLWKRFSNFKWHLIPRAKKIINKSTSLFVRPMLLSHIEELMKIKKPENLTPNDIYRTLIDKWIEREGTKFGLEVRYDSVESYKKLLYNFSMEIAYKIYVERHTRKGLFINNDSNFETTIFVKDKNQLGHKKNKKLSFGIEKLEAEHLNKDYRIIKSKSLLNRDTNGNYKFSHKSILEYFLALNIIEDNEKAKEFDFTSFDLVRKFILTHYGSYHGGYSSHRLPKLISKYILQNRDNSDIKYYIHLKYKTFKLFTKREGGQEKFPTEYSLNENYPCYIYINFDFDYIYRIIYEYNNNRLNEESINDYLNVSEDSRIVITNYIKRSKIIIAVSTFNTGDMVSNRRLVGEKHLYTKSYFDALIAYVQKMEEFEKKYTSSNFYY